MTRRNGMPGLPASNNFKVMYAGAKKLGYKQVHTGHLMVNAEIMKGLLQTSARSIEAPLYANTGTLESLP